MKKKTKGIVMFAFLGGIMVTSGVVIAIPGLAPEGSEQEMTVTGTPADNFPDEQRAQFCDTGPAKSTEYVTEYQIPTDCTQPLAMVSDPQGNIWFAQTNTGKIAKFDPNTETFTEYDNMQWPVGGRSMMWGMDYSPDGSIWYTDEAYDSIWKFSIQDEEYTRFGFPSKEDSLPQRLEVDGSQIIVNDFTGNQITFLDYTQSSTENAYLSLPSPVDGSLTSDFAVDENNDVWYTNWIFQQDGVLVKYDQDGYEESSRGTASLPLFDFIQVYALPASMTTPNGVAIGPDGNIWIVDTSSSFFFSFDPDVESFTQYTTTDPSPSAYGNASGIIRSPVSRPYWVDTNDAGQLVFNEQTANRIGIFDIKSQSLVEYQVPSKNPFWADCLENTDCGLAQIFGFTIVDDKIWFSQWVENNIGVLDTSKSLPFDVNVPDEEISLKFGESTTVSVEIIPTSTVDMATIAVGNPNIAFLQINPDTKNIDLNEQQGVDVTITATNIALPGTYNIPLGAQTDDVVVSKYVTVTILPSI